MSEYNCPACMGHHAEKECPLVDELLKACRVGMSALRSYQYGNSSTELATEVANHLETVIKNAGGKP
jgi:hypothetical protein